MRELEIFLIKKWKSILKGNRGGPTHRLFRSDGRLKYDGGQQFSTVIKLIAAGYFSNYMKSLIAFHLRGVCGNRSQRFLNRVKAPSTKAS